MIIFKPGPVLEIHMLRKAVTPMKAAIRLCNFEPANFITDRAILKCKLHSSIAIATISPPKKRKFVS